MLHLVALLAWLGAAAPCPAPPPPELVDVRELAPSLRLAIGYHGSANFTGTPLPGYEVARAWMRPQAAKALAAVQSDLEAEGLGLIVYDAYRPRAAVEAMVEFAEARAPELLAEGWVARHSDHSRGMAVDLGLVDVGSGRILDMGSGWDEFHPRSHLRGVTGPPLDRRLRLRAAMQRHGFRPYAREWWHFSRTTAAPALDAHYRCVPGGSR